METHVKEETHELASEVRTLRGELGGLVSDLGRRRREAFDVRLQIRRHPRAAFIAAAVPAALISGAIVRSRRRARRGQPVLASPKPGPTPAQIALRIASAVMTAIVAAGVRRMTSRAMQKAGV